MRKIKSAVWILVIVLAVSFCSHKMVHGVTTEIYTQLYAIKSDAQQGDYDAANKQLQDVLLYFDDRQHTLELFLKRENVAALSVNLHGLEAYLCPENLPDLYSEIDKAAEQVQMLEHLFVSIF